MRRSTDGSTMDCVVADVYRDDVPLSSQFALYRGGSPIKLQRTAVNANGVYLYSSAALRQSGNGRKFDNVKAVENKINVYVIF